jgi:hypothetical protein
MKDKILLPVTGIHQLRNDTPLELQDDEMYTVSRGTANLFAVRRFPDGTTGARFPIASFTEGSLILPVRCLGDVHYILTGSLDTQIQSHTVDSLCESCASAKDAVLFGNLLGAFFINVTECLKISLRYRVMNIDDSRTAPYPSGILISSDKLRWIKPVEGSTTFCGISVQKWVHDARFPVLGRHGISLEKESVLDAVDTAQLAESGELRRNLDAYLSELSELLGDFQKQSLKAEKTVSAEKLKRTDRTFSDSLERIRNLLNPREMVVDGGTDSENFLLAAVQILGKAQGITIKENVNKEYSIDKNGILEIAKDNNIRVRQVHLYGKWWTEDNGPLFGYYIVKTTEDGSSKTEDSDYEDVKPVALIPGKNGRYVMVDPETKETVIITGEVAANINATAYMLYRPFPDEKISFWNMIKFSVHDIQRDAVRYLILGIFSALIALLIPEITRIFMDSVIPNAAESQLLQITILVFVCIFSGALFDYVKSIAMIRIETKSDTILESAVMDRLLKLPVAFFRNYTAGDLSDRTMAITNIRRIISDTAVSSMMALLFGLVLERYNKSAVPKHPII